MSSQYSPDFIVLGRSGIAFIEVKKKLNSDALWAEQTYFMQTEAYNTTTLPYASYSKNPQRAFFLLIVPDRIYLWCGFPQTSKHSPPDYTIEATEIFKPYFHDTATTQETAHPMTFEWIVKQWLFDLLHSQNTQKQLLHACPELNDSNFFPFLIEADTLEYAVAESA